jgi:hypothetical protein
MIAQPIRTKRELANGETSHFVISAVYVDLVGASNQGYERKLKNGDNLRGAGHD